MQRRMLVEQRTVIERLSCKLGKDNEDLELQFSAAVAKVGMVILKMVKLVIVVIVGDVMLVGEECLNWEENAVDNNVMTSHGSET